MILNKQKTVRFDRRPLEDFLRRIRKELKLGKKEVSICFVTDAEIARLNQAFRKKKGPTDVLSFPAQGKQSDFLGDIAIAPATARRYARKNRRSFASEVRILMAHGILHLLGYDHETDRGEMDRIEHDLRRRLGLAQ
jgi:probable rRNA maturation factor